MDTLLRTTEGGLRATACFVSGVKLSASGSRWGGEDVSF